MSLQSEKEKDTVDTVHEAIDIHDVDALRRADDVRLAELGYKSEFKREFSVRAICAAPIFLSCEADGNTPDVRAYSIFLLDHGCRCLSYIHLFFSPCVWGACGHGIWLVDSMSFCYDSGCVHGRVGFVNAVSA